MAKTRTSRGSVYVRKNTPILWGTINHNGKQLRRSLDTTSRAEAEDRLAQWRIELTAGQWGSRIERLYEAVALQWMDEHLPTIKPSSARRYRTSLKNLHPHFEGMPVHTIDYEALYSFELARRREGVTTSTIRRDLRCVSSMLGDVDPKVLPANPLPQFLKARMKKGLREAPPKDRYLSREEEERLLPLIENHTIRMAVIFAIETGLRSEEQFSLTWSDIKQVGSDYEAHIRNHKSDRRKRTHIVQLTRRALEAINSLPQHYSSKYIFCHFGGRLDGQRWRDMYHQLKGITDDNGIDEFTWHDLRRTCGCRLLQDRGFTMEQVSKWLGHSSIKVTERHYAFLESRHLRKALNASSGSDVLVPLHHKTITVQGD